MKFRKPKLKLGEVKSHPSKFWTAVSNYLAGLKRNLTKSKVWIYIVLICLLLNLFFLYTIFSLTTKPTNLSKLNFKDTTSEANTTTKQLHEEIGVTSDKEIKLLFVGDTMLARNTGYAILNGGNPFDYVKDKLSTYDYVIANLETNISSPYNSPIAGKAYTFNAPIESISTLTDNNIKIVNLANNHVMDFHSNGLLEMIGLLNEKSVFSFGAGNGVDEAFRPLTLMVGGTSISLIGLNDAETWYTKVTNNGVGTAFLNETYVCNTIQKANTNSDIVIVNIHWGIEYDLNFNAYQRNWGQFAINCGADLIVGTHPHVVQGNEEYNGKKIYYSLGNFVFDGMYGIPNASDGQILEVNIQNKQITSSSLFGVYLDENGYPHLK